MAARHLAIPSIIACIMEHDHSVDPNMTDATGGQAASGIRSIPIPLTFAREGRRRSIAAILAYLPASWYTPKPTRFTFLSCGRALLTALVRSLALVLKPAFLTLAPISFGFIGVIR